MDLTDQNLTKLFFIIKNNKSFCFYEIATYEISVLLILCKQKFIEILM